MPDPNDPADPRDETSSPPPAMPSGQDGPPSASKDERSEPPSAPEAAAEPEKSQEREAAQESMVARESEVSAAPEGGTGRLDETSEPKVGAEAELASPPLPATESTPGREPAPESTPKREPTPEEARAREAVTAAFALLDGAAARLSAAAGGIRFSTLQKTQGGLAYEWRQMLRAEALDIPAAQVLLGKVERLIASLAPAQRPSADAAAPTGPGALRQTLVRGMIALAPAPLHLQIEFAPDFPSADADPLVLAARSHAVNRAALGSLRRIQWDAPDRCTLAFGDGEQRRTLVASFDAEGKLDLPPEFRQNQPRPVSKAGADATQPGGPGQGRTRQGGPRQGAPGQGGPGQGGRPGRRGGQQSGQPNAGPGQQDRQARTGADGRAQAPGGAQGRGTHGRDGQRSEHPGGNRPPRGGTPGGEKGRRGADGRDGRRGRDNRQDAAPRHAAAERRPAFPKNTAMAEKLRAALGPLARGAETREAPRAKSGDRPRRDDRDRPRGDGPRPERTERLESRAPASDSADVSANPDATRPEAPTSEPPRSDASTSEARKFDAPSPEAPGSSRPEPPTRDLMADAPASEAPGQAPAKDD